MIFFLLGLFVGFLFGFYVAALLAMGRRGDDQARHVAALSRQAEAIREREAEIAVELSRRAGKEQPS